MSRIWSNGSGLPLNASNLNGIENDISRSVKAWAANTSYTAGQAVLDPNGNLVTANATHTSGTSYNAANWSAPTTGTAPVSALDHSADTLRGLSLTKAGRVIAPGPSSFDISKVESPSIWWDDANQQYGMVYTGYDSGDQHASIGLAWSPDLISWTKAGTTPILAGSGSGPDSVSCTGPVMYIENGTYYLFYIGLTAVGYEAGTKTLCVATASSPTGPWTRQGAMIAPSGSGWAGAAVWHACIVKRRGTYYCFFNGSSSVDNKERIGYATAPSLLGPWTVDNTNSPLLSLGASGSWDENRTGDPSIYRVGNTWYMAYYGSNAGDAQQQDGVAYTTDASFPLGWTKHARNPILTYGGPSEIDSNAAAKPLIFITPGRHYHFYTAVGNLGRGIALAVSPGQRAHSMVTMSSQTRSTTSTTLVTMAAADILFDTTSKHGLAVRMHVRCNPGATSTLTVTDMVRPSLTVSATGNTWQNVSSPWVGFDDKTDTGLFYTTPKFSSSDGTSVSVAQVWYEFRWFSGN